MANKETKPNLIILIGVPGSGKTTLAYKMLKEDANSVRVNRDDIRKMIKGSYSPDEVFETLVSSLQDAAIAGSLKKKYTVILDNTNCRPKYIRELIVKYGKISKVTLEFVGVDLTLKQLYERNDIRDKPVPADVIEKMFKGLAIVLKAKKELNQLIEDMSAETILNEQTQNGQNENLPKCVLVDIDGTVAHMYDKRGPFEWNKVGGDEPDDNILDVVRALSKSYKVIFMSGRDSICRELTIGWLQTYYGADFELFMRPVEDYRKDSVVKTELYEKHIKGKYYVECVLDDRRQVVIMWRELGLKCLQVQDGDF